METFKGPFGSSGNFISMIALPNCIEYLQEHENGKGDATRRELTRLLFNAVIALDSIVDYRFFEQKAAATVDELVTEFAETEPAVRQIRELANAMKHCVRGHAKKTGFVRAEGKTHAREILTTKLEAEIDLDAGAARIDLSSSLLAGAHDAVEAAYRHWLPYAT